MPNYTIINQTHFLSSMTKKLETKPSFIRQAKDKLIFQLSPYFYPQYNYSRKINRFLKAQKRPLTIIDAGCGWGETSANFAKIPLANVYGYELDADCIERAKQNFRHIDNLSFEVKDIHQILPTPYPFDVFCMVCVMTVITNQDQLLQQIHHAMPPDAWLIVVNPNPDTKDYKVFQSLDNDSTNKFEIRPQDYETYFGQRGFELIKIEATGYVRRAGRAEERFLKIALPFYLHAQDFIYKRLGLGKPICHIGYFKKKQTQ